MVRSSDTRPIVLIKKLRTMTQTAKGLSVHFRVRACSNLLADFVFPIPGKASLAVFIAHSDAALNNALQSQFRVVVVIVFIRGHDARSWFLAAQKR